MTSWLASQIERPLTWARSASGRSAITIALISSTLTAFIILAGQDVHRRTTRKSLRDDVEARMLRDNSKRSEVTLTSYGTESLAEDADEEVIVDDTLIAEQLTRNIAFLGPEGMDKIRKSFVIIVGMGGVSLGTTMICLLQCLTTLSCRLGVQQPPCWREAEWVNCGSSISIWSPFRR